MATNLTRYHDKVVGTGRSTHHLKRWQCQWSDRMNQKLLHTPEGVRDIYKEECERKLELEQRLKRVMISYGFEPVETPSFEFIDVFSSEVGTISSRELYKFFDREGNTLSLRPDFTPSIARAVCKYFAEEEFPVRLWYQGHAFINHSSYQGRAKESTHSGAELIGDESAGSDAEIVAMAAESMRAAGLEEFQISLGNVQFFSALAERAGLKDDEERELALLLHNRNSFGAEKFLQDLKLAKELQEAFTAMPSLFGGEEVLEKALSFAQKADAPKAVSSIRRLMEVSELLKAYEVDRYISFDLGMMSTYHYYTGIIFRGYTYGTGDAVVKGGRYDSLLKHFGKDLPAIGFAAVIDELMKALERQKIRLQAGEERTVLTYTQKNAMSVIKEACRIRRAGGAVVLKRMKEEE